MAGQKIQALSRYDLDGIDWQVEQAAGYDLDMHDLTGFIAWSHVRRLLIEVHRLRGEWRTAEDIPEWIGARNLHRRALASTSGDDT